MNENIIGIIGGMGPMATLDLFYKIIINTRANRDQDHAHVIIDNNTGIPDRTKYILEGGESPEEEIFISACRLIEAGANILIMPCNTAHYFYNIIKNRIDKRYNKINYKFINMIEETAKVAQSQGCKRVFLLATKGTYESKIYNNIFKEYDIDIIIPDEPDQNIVMNSIYNFKKDIFNFYKDEIISMLEHGKKQGASKIVLGCTELPIIFKKIKIVDNIIDSTEVLALSALKALN